jgi:plasmid stabilization system protein ParE
MEQIKFIRYNRLALHDLNKIEEYIAEKGYPSTAASYTNRIIDFIKTLKEMPERTALCKYPAFAKRVYRCLVFENTYVIVYRINGQSVDIKRIIHGMRLNY